MAQDKLPVEALSETAAQAVEQNMEKYFSVLQNIWGSNDLTEKMKAYTEKNISACTEYIHNLSQAKSFPEVFRIQTVFMQTQVNTLQGLSARRITN
jgi:hypothetical protein